MKKFILNVLIIIVLISAFIPAVVGAAETDVAGGGCQPFVNPKFQDLLTYVTCIIGTAVVPLIFVLALVVFLWGVVQFVINGDDEAKKTKGKNFMIWGIIGLTVMVGVWGFVKIVGNTFGVNTSILPQVKP